MSAFGPPIELRPGRSRCAAALHLTAAGLALAALLLLARPWLSLPLAVVLGWHLRRQWRRQVSRRAPQAVTGLRGRPGHWQLQRGGGDWRDVTLEHAVVSPLVSWLKLREAGGRRRTLAIWGDAVAPEPYRRFRVEVGARAPSEQAF